MKTILLVGFIIFTKIYAMDMPQSQDFICPISMEIMEDPISASCGHIFDRKSIEAWLNEQNTCPICRKIIDFLSSETILREKIRQYKLNEQKMALENTKRQAWEKVSQQLFEEFCSDLRDFVRKTQ